MSFPETGTFEMYAEISYNGDVAYKTFSFKYDRDTEVGDILTKGCRKLRLALEDYDMYIEVPVGIPGVSLKDQIDNLQYVRLTICQYDDNFVKLIRSAQNIVSEQPRNVTIADDLVKNENIHLFKVYITA